VINHRNYASHMPNEVDDHLGGCMWSTIVTKACGWKNSAGLPSRAAEPNLETTYATGTRSQRLVESRYAKSIAEI